MRTHADKRAIHGALVDRILSGDARTSGDERRRAFHNVGLSEPLDQLAAAVAAGAGNIDDEIEAAKAAGCTEDQIFALVICAAVGAATRQYDAGLAALAQTTVRGE